MAKEDALLRDIAKLFVKYGQDEWRAVICLLRTGGPAHAEIANAIEEVQAQRRRPATGPAAQRSSRAKRAAKEVPTTDSPIPQGLEPLRLEALERVYSALKAHKVLKSSAALRDAYVKLGGKDALPKKREDAVRAVVRHMAGLSQPAFEAALQQIDQQRSDLQGEYSRWFDLIYKRGGSDPGKT